MRWLILCLLPGPVLADAVVTTRTIKAGQVIQAEDLSIVTTEMPGAPADPALIAGKEALVALYPGRPIRDGQFGPPAVVVRNQIVVLSYVEGTLAISTEGRALGRGGIGDLIPILNISSRNTIQGRVMPDGSVRVSRNEG